MELNLYFTVTIPDEVAARINDENDDFDALEVASTVQYSITSPYISEAYQVNDYEVVD